MGPTPGGTTRLPDHDVVHALNVLEGRSVFLDQEPPTHDALCVEDLVRKVLMVRI